MKKTLITILILILVTSGTLFGVELVVDNTGNTSLPMLSIGIDARASGMGEAMVAVSDDINALNWNPAGLADIKKMELTYTHSQFLADLMFNYLAGGYSIGRAGSIAIGLNLLTFGNLKEGFVLDTAAYGMAINVGYGVNIIEKLQIGLTAKYAIESWSDTQTKNKVNGFSFDLGLISRITKSISLGVALKNFGFNFSKAKMPLDVRYGLAYTLFTDSLVENLVISAEGFYSTFESIGARFGLELVLGNMPNNIKVAGRMGFRYPGVGGESFISMLDYGIGFSIFNVYLDWAMVYSGASLGSIHRFSLSYRLDKKSEDSTEEEEEKTEEEWMTSANNYMRSKDYENALNGYEEVINKNPKNLMAAYNIACIYSVNGDIKESITWLEHVLKIKPGLASRFGSDSDLKNVTSSDKYKDFIAQYNVNQGSVKKEPEKEVGLSGKTEAELVASANKYMKIKDYKNALIYYKAVINKNPSNLGALYNTACIYSVNNNIKESVAILESVLKLRPGLESRFAGDPDLKNAISSDEYKNMKKGLGTKAK